jgi:Protein of unknown function (DUF1566)
MRRLGLVLGLAGLLGSVPARAVDVPISGLKLIVVDQTATTGKAKAVFVAKDLGIAKGTGTDPTQISATLDVAYLGTSGLFTMPQGTNWLVNSASVGKYVNKTAPTGGATKVSIIKPASLVKVVATSLGDTPLDISTAPTGNVYVVDTIVNGGDETRLCTQFAGCVHKLIAGGTGYKLLCKGNSVGDPACTAASPITPLCVAISGTFCDLGGTVYDFATDLQWEQKDTAVGSGVDAGNLHDVDNGYTWAGQCSVTSKLCQPNLAAETACKAQTDMAYWASGGCEQCTGGEGTCNVDPLSGGAITTVWDWLAQVNAANFAGHNDWRLPSESGCNSCYAGFPINSCMSCESHELETILLSPFPCGTTPCIASIFGPTVSYYLSASTYPPVPNYAWVVSFDGGEVTSGEKAGNAYLSVRAVRGGS